MDTKTFLTSLLFLFFGLWLGFNLEAKDKKTNPIVVKKAVQKPLDTRPIGSCAAEIGIRQIKTIDLPFGPYYLTDHGKTIGLEFKMTKEEFAQGKSWQKLTLQEATFTTMDVVWVDGGDDGQHLPHYDIRLFTISADEKKQITC